MDQFGLILKTSRSGALATLVRILGDLDFAEEAVQEACYRALLDWKENGAPENPVAWLVQTGRRFAVDNIRHHQMATRKQHLLQPSNDGAQVPPYEEMASTLHQHDDQLRLIFTCCHPALSLDAQVALTLKTVAGLDTDEIARAYLVTAEAMQRRLTRAKEKIRDAGIPYVIPDDNAINNRLDAVMKVIYLIYNQAYTALKGGELLDKRLSEAAIYLARVLNRLKRNQPEVLGLLSLLLLQHARAAARTDDVGIPISLERQDRTLWDKQLIAEGIALLEKSARYRSPDPYQTQAAISAEHCKAETADATRWWKIVALYESLEAHASNPIVTLNRAVAVARLKGPGAGLVVLDSVAKNKQIIGFQYFHSARAGLFEQAGNYASARKAYEKSRSLCQNEAEKRYLDNKIQQMKAAS